MDLRQRLLEARTEDDFKRILLKHTQELTEEQAMPSVRIDSGSPTRCSNDGDNNVPIYFHFLFFYFSALYRLELNV